LGWVKDRCREEFGFTPYPGTLNIKVSLNCDALLGDFVAGAG
jgi:Domain of unknown function DUF120.